MVDFKAYIGKEILLQNVVTSEIIHVKLLSVEERKKLKVKREGGIVELDMDRWVFLGEWDGE